MKKYFWPLFLPSGGGVQSFDGGIHQRIADGGGNITAALAAHGHDSRHAAGFAGSEQPLLALYHIHKADRYADDQCRPMRGENCTAAHGANDTQLHSRTAANAPQYAA